MTAGPRIGRRAAGAMIGTLIACLAPSAASALGPTVTFHLFVLDECFELSGPPSTSIDVELRGRNGEMKGARSLTTDGGGSGFECFDAKPLPHDSLTARWGGSNVRVFAVPRLTVGIDRVTDVVSGFSTPNKTVSVSVDSRNAVSPPPPVTKAVSTAADGSYSADFTSTRNVRGGDAIQVRFTSGSGDTIDEFLRAPFMVIWVRNATFEAQLNPFQASSFTLRTSGGTVKAQMSRLGDEVGEVEEAFWTTPGGAYVTTAIGDKVSASFATDASMTIPALTFSANAATDVVSGSCLSDRRYWIDINGFNGSAFRIGNAGPTGAFSEDYTTGSTFDILAGDEVTVHCMFGTGDQVARVRRAT